jgi:hypothetical protein
VLRRAHQRSAASPKGFPTSTCDPRTNHQTFCLLFRAVVTSRREPSQREAPGQRSLDNPDHVDIVIHNYRWGLSLAKGEQQYDDLKARLSEGPLITVPTITIGSDFDGAAADGRA